LGNQAGETSASARPTITAPIGHDSARETEIKLAVDGPAIDAAEAFFTDANERAVESTYFDTEDLDLRRAGIDLRVRRDGNRLFQTIKLSSISDSPLTRREHETELKEPSPDRAHLRNVLPPEVRASIRDRTLKAQFKTVFQRRRRLVPASAPIAEAVFDRGTIEAGDRVMPISEVEFELLDGGDIAGLVRECLAFLDTVPAGFGNEAKSARGFRLATRTSPAPVYGRTMAIRGESLLSDTIRNLFRQSIAHFLGNLPAFTASAPPASVHQMRVGLRRLRSTVSAFRPVLDPTDGEAILAEARDLFNALGTIRDLDVLVATTLPDIGADILDARLRRAVETEARRQRHQAVEAVRKRIAGPDFARFVVNLIGWVETGRWLLHGRAIERLLARRTAGEFAAVRLESLHRKLVKAGRKARRRDKEAWHRARIAAKKLRYAAEPLLSALDLGPEVTRDYAQALKRLQETLGALNDVQTAKTLLQEIIDALDGHAKARAVARKNLKHWEKVRSETTLLEAAREFRRFEQAGFPAGAG
jgi:inorganic triphosphatase YgiF